MSNWQAAIREAYATSRTDIVYLDTLEISNPATGTLYLVQDRVDNIFRLEDGSDHLFTACGFRFSLPAVSANGLQDLALAIDNVDRRASDFITSAIGSGKPVQVIYRPYMSNDLLTPQLNPPLVLYLTDIVISALDVSGRATFADLLNRRFLTERYTHARFPSL